MNDIQKIEDNHGQIAQNVSGNQIQTNNYFSFSISDTNDFKLTIDSDQIKQDYLNHYQLFVEELDGIFDNYEDRYFNKFLSDLIDIKVKKQNFHNLTVNTKKYLDLIQDLQTADLDKKIEIVQIIEDEKIKCKELSLLFDLIFENIIQIKSSSDIPIIINTIYILLTSEIFDSLKENDELRDFYESYELSKTADSKDSLKNNIATFLYKNISENIFIPSTIILRSKSIIKNDRTITMKYSFNKKIGFMESTELKDFYETTEVKAQFYTKVIQQIIYQNTKNLDYNYIFNIENYTVELIFTTLEKNIRSHLQKYIYNSNSKALEDEFEQHEYLFKQVLNPI